MTKHNRFARGSAVFTCRSCKRQTRETSRDHAQTGNCEDCFELAGIENTLLDADDPAETFATYRDEINERIAHITKLGGDVSVWNRILGRYFS